MKKCMVLLIIAGLVPAACAELMPDGGFEGAGVWSGNGGYFSDSVGYWQYADITSTSDVHTGSNALRMRAPGSAESWAYLNSEGYYDASSVWHWDVYDANSPYDLGNDGWVGQWQLGIVATAGDVLQASAWIKKLDALPGTGVAMLRIECKASLDGSGDNVAQHEEYFDATTGWAQIVGTEFVVPDLKGQDTVESVGMVIGFDAHPGNNGAYHDLVWDDVSLIKIQPPKAYNPGPADDANEVSVTTALTWLTGDPNTTSDLVYWGTDPGALTEVPESPLPAGTETWDPPGRLNHSTEYFWRVDEFIDNQGVQNDYTLTGDVWSFTTIDTRPEITSQPSAAFANPNDTMTISAVEHDGESTGYLTYQWYNSGGVLSDDAVISGSTTSTVTFTGPGESYADSYYCVVTDTVEALSTTSDSALMDIPRLYAHFTFEPDTVSGPNVENIISGAQEGSYEWDTPNGGPVTFGAGHNGAQAIEFADDRALVYPNDDDEWMYMDPSILDPVVANGQKQMTIAMWAYLDEAATARQTLFSILDNANWDPILEAYCPTTNGGGTISFEGDIGAESVEWTIPDANDLLGQWYHFAFSKNVDTGDMKLYMNGEWKNTSNATLADIQTTDLLGVYLGVGKLYNETFTGRLDDFRMYNYALSDAEVSQLYACTSLAYDLDFSCNVDLIDYAKLAEQWDGGAGGGYDIDDLAGLCSEWLEDNTL